MIDKHSQPVAWALLIDELDEAKEHLASLTENWQQRVASTMKSFASSLATSTAT